MSLHDLRPLFERLARAFEEKRDELIALDGKVGDSDLGITMAKGFSAARDAVVALGEAGPSAQAKQAGAAIAKAAPSTMGTLMATGFLRGSKAIEMAQDVGTAELAAFFAAFRDGIAQRGRAKLGDKTVLDVLHPIAETLEAEAAEGTAPEPALARAVEAARDGLEKTKDLVAQHGKAAAFQEKSRGLPDAGGTAAVILAEAFHAVFAEAG
ncbi:dihydroxyacetone kinase subunit L [Aurantimonas sp. VKM B-3413]|uniref:dihydroxyacetone kinase subunit L n=1 Tax=Aurantimonas sp. VKM B-3413 TaxID=2779401 RepID=UPI001E29705A|nr:dihydroxyacetone kinase subunit L [Aurantimonas sp. VKM B-3413]MCB8836242.1 dihydroxyacetone kinase subunit L [Aurantimonas sp. VKM B-3413]